MHEPAATKESERSSAPIPSGRKLPVFLVTSDDSLWTQIGDIGNDWIPKQVDSIDELVATTQSGQPGVVLWDVRGCPTPSATLSRVQLHSDRFAIIALDGAPGEGAWTVPLQQRQVAAFLSLPIDAQKLIDALKHGREEINARVALLGDVSTVAPSPPGAKRRFPWVAGAVIAGVLSAFAATVLLLRHNDSAAPAKAQPGTVREPREPDKPSVAADERVDSLIDRAQQAMLDRHYLDPADGSALALYREALILDPSNGEVRQGLERLAQVLFARVQSALDERKFDVALQALETARSISPDDPRLATLDGRIAAIRNELGPAQIQAAINAQNFDRATQLIDEAARAKMLSSAKLTQLRDDVRLKREQSDIGRYMALIDSRLQQDRLIDPYNDSAAFYLNQARQENASSPALQLKYQEFLKRSLLTVRGAIDQRRFADADRLLAELRNSGVSAATMAALQRDLNTARSQPTHEEIDQALLKLAQNRLAQGRLTEPENDSALFYVNRLRAADPQDARVVQVASALQSQILDHARAAIDAADTAMAEALIRLADGLGPSADGQALNERLLQTKLVDAGSKLPSAGAMPEVAENLLARIKSLTPQYPRVAEVRNIEGWVELGYTVTDTGKVIDVNTLSSNPVGVFEAAAMEAVSQMRYQPVKQNGKAIAVGTKIRVTFRLSAAR
jgi:protein TonB